MTFGLAAPLLDACVLGVLARGDSYGYTLTQQVRAVVDISESTLYPVLRRLQKDGLLTTYDQPFQGRNRRYYQITEAGRMALKQYQTAWRDYRDGVEQLLGGGEA